MPNYLNIKARDYSAEFEGRSFPFYDVTAPSWDALSLEEELLVAIPYMISSYYAGDAGGCDPALLIQSYDIVSTRFDK